MNLSTWQPHTPLTSGQPNRWTRAHSIVTPFRYEGHTESCWTARAGERYAVGFEKELTEAQRKADEWIAAVWALAKAGE